MLILDPVLLEKNITERIESDIAAQRIPGADVIVNQNGKRVLTKRYGALTVGGTPLPERTVYRAASMTKPITAVAVLREVGKGNLDLNKDISEYLGVFKDPVVAKITDGKVEILHKAKNPIRLRNLLSHSSGIGCGVTGNYFTGKQNRCEGYTLADNAMFFGDKPIEFDPGENGLYSPTAALDVAARILELSSGEKFGDYVRKYICEPLGMKDTVFVPNDEQWKRIIPMHGRNADGNGFVCETRPGCVFQDYPATYCCAGAGLATTAEDYSLFAEMLLSGGKTPDGVEIISPEMLKLMSSPQDCTTVQCNRERWGFGVRVIVTDSYTLPRTTFGWSGAYGTHFWVDPVNKITAVYMKNSTYDGGSGAKTASDFETDVMKSMKK